MVSARTTPRSSDDEVRQEPVGDPSVESVVQDVHQPQPYRHRALQRQVETEHHLEQGMVPQAEWAPRPARVTLLLGGEGPVEVLEILDGPLLLPLLLPPLPLTLPESLVRAQPWYKKGRVGEGPLSR